MTAFFLVIDSGQETTSFLRRHFPEPDYVICSACGMDDAREEMNHRHFDLVFMDTALVEEAARDAVREINETSPQTPILMLESTSGHELDLFSLGENIFAVISRPFAADSVKCLVRQVYRMRDLSEQMTRMEREAAPGDLKNPVTGLYAERYLHERISSEFQRARRYAFSLSVVLIRTLVPQESSAQDAGKVSRGIARFLSGFIRKCDVVTHYGDDCYLILLPDTGKRGALVFAKRLLDAVKKGLRDLPAHIGDIRFTAGISSFPEDGVKNEMGLLDLAERALERAGQAKDNGLFAFRGLEAFDIQNFMPPRKKTV